MSNQPLDIEHYRRVRAANGDFARALARTSLAVRCWLDRVKELPTDDGRVAADHRRVLAWLLANHLIQGYYRRCGVDVRPFDIGGMYGYGFAVGPQEPVCRRRDLRETAWVACGSVRVDPQPAPGEPEDRRRPYWVCRAIAAGEDPLGVIDRAAVVALGQRWPPECPEPSCPHRADAEIYLTVHQIITLLLAMGYLADAILGTFVDCSLLTGPATTARHPLRLAGAVARPGFAPEWFELGPTPRGGPPLAWIHRRHGELVLAEHKRAIPYREWCGGSVERGLDFLCRRIGV